MPSANTKRANFELTPEQDEVLNSLRQALSASSIKDTVLRAAQLANVLVNEVRQGNHLDVGRHATQTTRLLIPELEGTRPAAWQWLVERPHPWRRQLWVKGRKLLASSIWLDSQTNAMNPEEAAQNWDLPLAAIHEVFRYCEENQALIAAELDEEHQRLQARGLSPERGESRP